MACSSFIYSCNLYALFDFEMHANNMQQTAN